jgi:hypothetical protein
MFNLDGKIGGDAELSARGEMYAKKLPALVRESVGVSVLDFLQLSPISLATALVAIPAQS